jgi:hypothetical protein
MGMILIGMDPSGVIILGAFISAAKIRIQKAWELTPTRRVQN